MWKEPAAAEAGAMGAAATWTGLRTVAARWDGTMVCCQEGAAIGAAPRARFAACAASVEGGAPGAEAVPENSVGFSVGAAATCMGGPAAEALVHAGMRDAV